MNRGRFTSTNSEWETPIDLFYKLSDEFGGFDLDPCATKANAKCLRYFDKSMDGLKQKWEGRVFMNPPYGAEISK